MLQILLLFIKLGLGLGPIELVPVPGYVWDINQVCRFKCRQCVNATPQNLPYLVCILRRAGVSQAAVCGWNGCEGNFVVQDNGRVRCYGSDRLGINYVFCYKLGYCPRPCPNPCRYQYPYGPFYQQQFSENLNCAQPATIGSRTLGCGYPGYEYGGYTYPFYGRAC